MVNQIDQILDHYISISWTIHVEHSQKYLGDPFQCGPLWVFLL